MKPSAKTAGSILDVTVTDGTVAGDGATTRNSATIFTKLTELGTRTERGVRNEEELLLSPALFTAWKSRWPEIARAEVTPNA